VKAPKRRKNGETNAYGDAFMSQRYSRLRQESVAGGVPRP
jgi:hypothetical protein